MSCLAGQGSPGNVGACHGRESPPVAKVTVPRLSLPESNPPQVSPRAPLSPRGAGPSSPNARQKAAPGSDQKGSPRFGETPRDSARDSARARQSLSARRRTEDSVNAYISRRQSCNSTGKRSSAGSASRTSARRPNPLLSGNAKAETPARRRSPRDATPEHYPDTGGASCSGARGSGSAHSTPVRSHGVHAKHRRGSSPSPVLLKDVMRAVASSLSSLGAGDSHPPDTHGGDHEDDGAFTYGAATCSISSLGAGTPCDQKYQEASVTYPASISAHLVHDIPVIPAAAVGSRGPSTDRRMSADSRYSADTIAVDSAFATATHRMSADSRCSAETAMATQRFSQSEKTSPSAQVRSDHHACTPTDEHSHRRGSFRSGHKKTPSFTRLQAATDDGALRTARRGNSPVYDESSLQHLDRECGAHLNQFDDDELNAGNSTYARLEELTDKVQRLFVEVSASLDTPAPQQPSNRPAVGPPCRPPRPPPPAIMPMSVMPGYGCTVQASPVATPDGMSSFLAQDDHVEDDEISRLKFRVHHLELSLQQRQDPSGQAACGQDIVALKQQLQDTTAQLVEAKDEIQQARVQIHVLSQRMNGLQSARSDSAPPMQSVTPRVIPAGLAGGTPPAPSRANHVHAPLPMTARQRPPSPQCGAGHSLTSVSSSPLPTARVQRQGSYAPPSMPRNGSYAPPSVPQNGSYAPPARVMMSTSCGSARASPARQTEFQSQSAACLAGTPPAPARMCSAFAPPARGVPMKVGVLPAHMVASPRLAG